MIWLVDNNNKTPTAIYIVCVSIHHALKRVDEIGCCCQHTTYKTCFATPNARGNAVDTVDKNSFSCFYSIVTIIILVIIIVIITIITTCETPDAMIQTTVPTEIRDK